MWLSRPVADPIQQQERADKEREYPVESVAGGVRMAVHRAKDRQTKQRR